MTERERWIVYPILFLTLGIALRDKMFQRVATKAVAAETSYADVSVSNTLKASVIECEQIIVHARGRPVIKAGSNREGSGTIQTFAPNGEQLVVLEDNQFGGIVTATDYGQNHSIAIGHAGGYAGLLVGPARGILGPWLPSLTLRRLPPSPAHTTPPQNAPPNRGQAGADETGPRPPEGRPTVPESSDP